MFYLRYNFNVNNTVGRIRRKYFQCLIISKDKSELEKYIDKQIHTCIDLISSNLFHSKAQM